MVVKARDDVTVATLNDVAMVLPYYLTQSNTESAPATPTTNPPTGDWTNAEPTYNSSNTVYMSFLTVFSDGSFDWSTPSKSSNYEAAKAAYNKATRAYDTANDAMNGVSNSVMTSLPTESSSRSNQWLCLVAKINDSNTLEPTYMNLLNRAINKSEYYNDSGLSAKGFGDYTIGVLRTIITVTADKKWSGSFSHDDGAYIYLDGINVGGSNTYKTESFSITIPKGQHIVDIIWYNSVGDDGVWSFSVALSSIATTMYAPVGTSALATDLDKAQVAAKEAQTTADGKNKIVASETKPSTSKMVPGDLWFQLDASKNVMGIQVWNGSAFVDYVLMANKILVAGSITGDKLDVGSVASAIVTSGLFQTASSGARVKIDSSGIKGYDANGSMTFEIDAMTGNVAMIGKFYSGDSSVSRVIIDDDYNNIDDPQYVDIDGYVAFENPLSDVSPFIGGTHGTQTGTKYTGTIVTSGVTDSKTPSGASIQLVSLDNGAGSSGTLASNMDKSKINKNAARVDVHSGTDGQMASLIAYDGTSTSTSVNAVVDANGNHSVDIVATDIYQVDPTTGKILQTMSSNPRQATLQNGFYYFANHGVVTVGVDWAKTGGGSWDAVNAPFVIPSDLCPKRPVHAACVVDNGASHTKMLCVTPDGTVRLSNQGGSGSSDGCYGSVSYPVA